MGHQRPGDAGQPGASGVHVVRPTVFEERGPTSRGVLTESGAASATARLMSYGSTLAQLPMARSTCTRPISCEDRGSVEGTAGRRDGQASSAEVGRDRERPRGVARHAAAGWCRNVGAATLLPRRARRGPGLGGRGNGVRLDTQGWSRSARATGAERGRTSGHDLVGGGRPGGPGTLTRPRPVGRDRGGMAGADAEACASGAGGAAVPRAAL